MCKIVSCSPTKTGNRYVSYDSVSLHKSRVLANHAAIATAKFGTRLRDDAHHFLPCLEPCEHSLRNILVGVRAFAACLIYHSRVDHSISSIFANPNISIMGSIPPPATDIESLGHRIQTLTADIQRARNNNSEDLEAQDQLSDALEDLRAEIVEPKVWPAAFFAFPEFAAMQVAYQRDIFRNVPLETGATVHARDLAALVEMDEDLLLRIMRCLATIKLFVEVDEKVFAHTPVSAAQADEHHAIRVGYMFGNLFKASSSLGDAIETKKASAWESRFGIPMHEYLEKTSIPDRDRMAKAMFVLYKSEREEVATLFPWQNFHKVVDIGGGAGDLVATLAQVSRSASTTFVDL